jgi:hypothetical protein
MLQNKKEEKFKLNLQLFAEDDDKKDEFIGAELKQMDLSGFVKKEDLSELENRILQALKPKEDIKKEENKAEDKKEDMPTWAKGLFDKIESMESSSKESKNKVLAEKKSKLAKELELEDSDLVDINDEATLGAFERNMKKAIQKKEESIAKNLPELLKKQGKEIVDFNKINTEKEKVKNEKFNKMLKFLG